LIIRILRGWVPEDRIGLFREQAQRVLDRPGCQGGLVNVAVGRQARADGCEQVVFVTVWSDVESLYRWVGDDLMGSPLLVEGQDSPFAEYDVQHYEGIEVGPSGEEAVRRPAADPV
jgi:hypothetical protein